MLKRYTRNYIRIFAIPAFITLYLIAMYFSTTNSDEKKVDRHNFIQGISDNAEGYISKFHNALDQVLYTKRDENLPRPDNENDVVHLDNFVDKMDFGDNVAEIELYKVGDMVEGDDTTKILQSTPDDIIHYPTLHFLNDVKNPCFALNSQLENIENISMEEALEQKHSIKCLPHVFLAGFNGCGTDDLMARLQKHRLIATNDAISSTTNSRTESIYPHFWVNLYKRQKINLDDYANLYQIGASKISNKYVEQKEKGGKNLSGDEDSVVLVDPTPYTVWYGDKWRQDQANENIAQPRLLLPQKILHTIPNSKIIIMLKSPTDRLIEDFNKYYSGKFKTDKNFQKLVLDAIEWWKHCLEDLRLPLRTCAYGKADPNTDLDELDFEKCLESEEDWTDVDSDNHTSCHDQLSWNVNPADRLRIGLYYIYLKDWFSVYRHENILVIKYEEYIKDPVEIIQRKVIPFLKLSPLTEEEISTIREIPQPISSQMNNDSDDIIASELTRSIIDDFYQVPGQFLQKVTNDETLFWPAIYQQNLQKKIK